MRPKGCLRGIVQLLLLVLLLVGTALLGRAAIQGIVDLRTRLNVQQLHEQEIVVYPQTATAIGMLQPTVIAERTLWQSPTPQPSATDDTSMSTDTSTNSPDTSQTTSPTVASTVPSGTVSATDTPLPRAAAIATNTPPARESATQIATQAQVFLQPITVQAVTQSATKISTQAATQEVALLASETKKAIQAATQGATQLATQKATQTVIPTATQKATQVATQAPTQSAGQALSASKPATMTLTATLTQTAARTAIPSSTSTVTPSRTPTAQKPLPRAPTATKRSTPTRTAVPSKTPTVTPSPTASMTPASVDLTASAIAANTAAAGANADNIVPTLIAAFPTITDTPVGMQASPRPTGFVDPSALLGELSTPNPIEIIPPTKVVTPGNPSTVCSATNAKITSPATGSTLRGIVDVVGSANIPNFGYYKLEFRSTRSAAWEPVNQSDAPVTNDLLGTIDTSLIQPGYYWIQLTVFDATGANTVIPCAILVRVLP